MTLRAVWKAAEDGESVTHFATLEQPVTLKCPAFHVWSDKRIATLRAEEVLVVVGAHAEIFVIEGDVRRVRDDCMTVIAAR